MRDGQFKTQTAGARFGTEGDDLPSPVRCAPRPRPRVRPSAARFELTRRQPTAQAVMTVG